MSNFKRFGMMLALVGAAGMLSTGCFVSASAEPAVATNYYTPMYYNGYVVYYDTLGRPMYYVGGAQYYVPSTYASYHLYTNHWRTNRVHYNRWYGSRGHRYRTYRRSHRAPRRGRRAPVRSTRRHRR